jgi:hypothetical protein
MTDSRTFVVNPDFQVERFENEILLYAVSGGKGIYLNETAYLVWQLCRDGYSPAQVVALLEEKYPEQREAIGRDVDSAVRSLLECGALQEKDA